MIEFQLQRQGILFLLSAPSGGGKSTILRSLLEQDATLGYSISATTRQPRAEEQDGREYFFRSVGEFQDMIDEGAFLEHAVVHGNYYGTLNSEIDSRLSVGKDVILDVDVKGSMAIKEARPETVTIFVLPPSISTLQKRLRNRGTDNEEALAIRLNNAREEVRYASLYDFVIVNEQLSRTITGIQEIIHSERRRGSRMQVTDALGEIEFISREAALMNIET